MPYYYIETHAPVQFDHILGVFPSRRWEKVMKFNKLTNAHKFLYNKNKIVLEKFKRNFPLSYEKTLIPKNFKTDLDFINHNVYKHNGWYRSLDYVHRGIISNDRKDYNKYNLYYKHVLQQINGIHTFTDGWKKEIMNKK